MSLISHLRRPKSPVRAWFERNLAGTRPVVAAANDQLCGKPRQPCLIAPPAGSDAALVGIAADYLVRAVLRRGALEETVATHGALSAEPPVGMRLEREAVQAIDELRPWESPTAGEALAELSRLCLVLARFDQAVRATSAITEKHVISPLRDDPTLAVYSKRVAHPSSVDDLARLGQAAIADHLAWRECRQLVLNPKFVLSVALGGADADLIADGVLWDLKSTANAQEVVGRKEIWQLVGYALADCDDEYAITRVGISALRRRATVVWPLHELLATLSDQPSRTIAAWRTDFASTVLETSELPEQPCL